MAHPKLKINSTDIIHLWFAQDTPIWVYKRTDEPRAVDRLSTVKPGVHSPSGVISLATYRKRDLIGFSKAVQQELQLRKLASQDTAEYA